MQMLLRKSISSSLRPAFKSVTFTRLSSVRSSLSTISPRETIRYVTKYSQPSKNENSENNNVRNKQESTEWKVKVDQSENLSTKYESKPTQLNGHDKSEKLKQMLSQEAKVKEMMVNEKEMPSLGVDLMFMKPQLAANQARNWGKCPGVVRDNHLELPLDYNVLEHYKGIILIDGDNVRLDSTAAKIRENYLVLIVYQLLCPVTQEKLTSEIATALVENKLKFLCVGKGKQLADNVITMLLYEAKMMSNFEQFCIISNDKGYEKIFSNFKLRHPNSYFVQAGKGHVVDLSHLFERLAQA
eukprot:jgi/Bigna1/86435/estExt_fgenesh1_pg.C_100241